MPKPVAEVGEGHDDASGNGVYCFIRDLIVEGRDARFVDKRGRYVINWSRALKCYHDYKSKRNPQYKSKNINRRKASNGLRAALLNFYKKEGAKEYNDGKKVNENNEVVERQFQMPPRLFESLFGSDAQLSDDSSEHETNSTTSEADEKPLAAPNSSDTGFDEAMDISDDLFNANEEPNSHCALGGLPVDEPLCSNVKTEEDQVDPSNITSPCQMFDISGEELDLVIGEICSNSDTNDIDLLGVVRDICPSSGSVKGGIQFYISLTEELSEDDKSGIAHFDGIGDVCLEKLNCYTLAGTIPASQQPGTVPVTVSTQDGHLLGMTCFMYVDEIQEVLKQVVKDPALQSLYLTMWSQEYGFFGNDGNLDPFTSQGAGSSIQGTHTQALKGLQLLVYTAAQTNAQQFIQMIFSTSAGRLVFNAYKNRPQLPEDVARANGHDDLAQYLQDVNARLSKENSNDAQPSSFDWLELIEAVNKIQKQSCVVENETDLEIRQSKDDDNESDYFADAETSSCGSFELEFGWSDSEDGEGPCSKGGGSDKEPDVKSAPSMNVMQCKAYTCAEVEAQSDNYLEDDKNSEEDEVKEVCGIGCFGQQIGVPTQNRENTSEREPEARACLDQEKCIQWKSPFTKDERPKKEPDARLTPCMEGTSSEAPTVLGTNLDNETDQKAGGKSDRKLVTTEVEKSSLVSQLSKKVAAIGKEEEASTVPSQEKTTKPKRTRKWLKGDAVTTSSQQGACVNETHEVPSFRERSYQGVTGGGTRDRENINDRKEDATTGLNQAKRHKQSTQWRPSRRALLKSFFLLTITVITVLCLAAGIKLREGQLLHWAVRNGHIRISQALLKFVSDVDAPNFRGQTPLHVAAKNRYKDLAEVLMKFGSNVNSNDYQQQTPLHIAAWSGCQVFANALVRHGSDVNARDDSQRTLHLAAWSGGQEIANALTRHGSDVNARDESRQTPLHLAALEGHRKVIQVLIQSGSDVNAKERIFGWTPFHLAVLAGHKESGEILVQHGSVIPVRLVVMNDLVANEMVPVLLLESDEIIELLILHGTDVNAGNKFRGTPLHSAVNNLPRNIAKVLLQDGRDVNARDIFGQTSLHLAARSGDQEITEFLTQQGSELKVEVFHCTDENPRARSCTDENARDGFQLTPIYFAAGNGHQNISEALKVSTLLTRYGNDYFKNKLGGSPLYLAAWSGHQERTEFLKSHGNERKARDDFQPNADVNDRHNRGQSPLHLATENGYKHICDVLRHKNCHSLNNNKTNFPQTSCQLLRIHWRTQSCFTPVNLLIGLGDKLSVTQCLSISLDGGGRINHHINHSNPIKYFNPIENSAYQALRSRYTSVIDPPFCILFSTKLAADGRPKDKDGSEAKISHSFGFVDNCIKNGTNKVLIRSELPVKEIAYEEKHLVNATVLLLMTLVSCAVLCYLEFPNIFMEGAHNGCRANSSSGPFSKDEQPKKLPDERLTQKKSMEGTSSEAPTVLGTNLDNELDQKDDGKNDRKLCTTEAGESSLIRQLSKKFAAGGRELLEASTKITFKLDRPNDSDLDDLAGKIAVKWKKVGLHLGLSLADLHRIDQIEANKSLKAYRMLLDWRNTTTSTALYRDLYFALCHPRVALANVAKQFCGKETTLS